MDKAAAVRDMAAQRVIVFRIPKSSVRVPLSPSPRANPIEFDALSAPMFLPYLSGGERSAVMARAIGTTAATKNPTPALAKIISFTVPANLTTMNINPETAKPRTMKIFLFLNLSEAAPQRG